MPIVKTDGTVRLCGNYKVTVNQMLEVDQYPLLYLRLLEEESNSLS